MLQRALERGIPVLGVCRGVQMLNIVLGGTLVQHLPDTVGHNGHNPTPGVFGTTTVGLVPGGRVATAVGPTVAVQCHHHQAVDRLADGLVVTGRAGDGTVEAVELDGRPFVVGVQWHPEQDATDVRLMAALVTAVRG
jgi:gamma-glutamyl-gamma-aminobutyrate hydrolase PuuD